MTETARPSRTATLSRTTRESSVEVSLDIDGTGQVDISTSVPFFDHMLTHLARHGLFDLRVECQGDLHIDAHHTVEDVAIALGLKAVFLVTTVAGVTGLWPAILADTGATVLVTLNALRLLGYNPERES